MFSGKWAQLEITENHIKQFKLGSNNQISFHTSFMLSAFYVDFFKITHAQNHRDTQGNRNEMIEKRDLMEGGWERRVSKYVREYTQHTTSYTCVEMSLYNTN